MPLSEHVYSVAIAFQMTEQVEQQICFRFFVQLAHSSVETIWMIQKPAAMGNWWLLASLWQYTCPCITSCAEFLAKCQITQVTQPRFGTLWLLAFPKSKITFEREEISDCQWDSGKYSGAANEKWENCVRFQSAYIEGNWGNIVLCTVFFVSCIFFNKCLCFS